MTKTQPCLDISAETPLGSRSWRPLPNWTHTPRAEDSQVEVSLARVWAEVTAGRCRIIDTFVNEQRCYVILEPKGVEGVTQGLLSKNRVRTLESILLGESRKLIALHQKVTVRSVTANATYALRGIGCPRLLSRLPLALFTLVHAAYERTDITRGRIGPLEQGDTQYRVLGIQRVDDCVGALLSPAEAAVTRLFIGGESHDEIARLRNTARHTIANQLTATFQKFGVSGRIELICMLHRGVQEHDLRCRDAVPRAQPVATRSPNGDHESGDGRRILTP